MLSSGLRTAAILNVASSDDEYIPSTISWTVFARGADFVGQLLLCQFVMLETQSSANG
jgi:hypothetical protein